MPARIYRCWLWAAVYALPSIAHADLAMPPDSAVVASEEIVVIGVQRDQRLTDSPISATVLNGFRLESMDIDDLETLTDRVPTLTIAKNSNASKAYIRGIGSQGNAGLDQSIATYIDHAYHPRSRDTKAALVDVQQVEILRGPQSLHLGLNASGGAIAVTTRKANPQQAEGYVRGSVGQGGAQRYTLAYNSPITENLALRGVVEHTDFDGLWRMVDALDGTTQGNGGGEQRNLYRLSARWQPNISFTADLKMERQDRAQQNPFAWQPYGCSNLYGLGLFSQAQLDSYWSRRASGTNPLRVPETCGPDFADNSLNTESPAAPYNTADFRSQENTLNLHWQKEHWDLRANTWHYDNEFSFAGNDVTHGVQAHRTLWVRDTHRMTAQDIRLEVQTSQQLRWMFGAYWHKADVAFNTGDADVRRTLQFVRTQAQQRERSLSAFSAIEWLATANLQLTLGLRWVQTRKRFAGQDEQIRINNLPGSQRANFANLVRSDATGNPRAYRSFDGQVRGAFNNRELQFSRWLPNVNVSLFLSDATLFYAKWQKGYKAGGFNFRLNGLSEDSLEFDPESVSAYEIGIKTTFLDGDLSTRIALFVSNYDDLQHNSNRGDAGEISAAVIRNAASVSSDGIEVDGGWQINPNWSLDSGVTYLHARFDAYPGADCSRLQAVLVNTALGPAAGATAAGRRCSQDLSGRTPAHAPELAGYLAANYVVPLSEDISFSTRFEWVYSDAFYTSPHADELRRQAAYHKFNARISLRPSDDRWEMGLLLKNLTNRLTARQLGQDGDAAVSALVDTPRQAILQMQWNW